MSTTPKLEEGDLEAVVSSALVCELKLGDFFALRELLRQWEQARKKFRIIHLTFSNRQFYIVKRQEYQKFKDWMEKRGETK